MISLRSFATLTAVVVAALSLAACNDGPANPLSTGIQPGGASFNTTVAGKVDARVLLDKSGGAVVEFHTGTFDDATNATTPQGTFSSITYTVKNGSKTVVSHTVSFSKTTSKYFAFLNLCATTNDDDDDDNGSPSCATKWATGYKLSFTANLAGLGTSGTSKGTASGDAAVLALPDVNLTQSLITVAGVPNAPASSVPANVATTFSVDVPNNVIQTPFNTVNTGAGVDVSCLVTVDGFPQLPLPNGVYNKYLNPNAYGYIGDPILHIPAGGHTPCQFTLTLPAGPHKVVVTGVVIYPGDYDFSNNSTVTFTVTGTTAATNFKADALQIDIGGNGSHPVNYDPLATGQTAPQINPNQAVTLVQQVSMVEGAPPGAIKCTATITPPTGPATTVVATATLNSSNVACLIPYTFAGAGSYAYSATVALASGASDATPENNTKTSTLVVTPPPKSTVATISQALSFSDAAITPAGTFVTLPSDSVLRSGNTIKFTTKVKANTFVGVTGVDLTCTALIDGATPATGITWISGPTFTNVASDAEKDCTFTYKFTDADITPAGVAHTVGDSVTVGGGVVNLAASGTTVGTRKIVETVHDAVRLDLSTRAFQLVGGTNPDLATTTNKQGSTATIRIPVFGPPNTAVTCGQLYVSKTDPVTGAQVPDTIATTLKNPPQGTTQITLNASGQGFCSYTVSAPIALGLASIPVIAQITPTSATAPLEPTPADNFSTGRFVIVSNGAFTTLPIPQSIVPTQSWANADGTDAPIKIGGLLIDQKVFITRLALLVVPVQDFLGSFNLTATTTSGTPAAPINFGTAATAYAQLPKTPDQSPRCNREINSGFVADEPALTYDAYVCAEPSTIAGYQQITVTFNLSTGNLTKTSATFPKMFSDTITVSLRLGFNLQPGAPENDHVTALIKIPVDQINAGCTFDETAALPRICSSSFKTATVTTPSP